FQYEDDNSDDCPVCYGADGMVFYSGQTTGYSGTGNEDYYTSKHGTDIEGYFGNPYTGCVDNGGELCGQDEFCSVEYNIISSSDQHTCCYNEALRGNYPSDGVCVPIQGAEYLSCADQGGELMPNPVDSPGLYCANIIDSSDSDDTQGYVCCKTGVMYSADWVVDSPFEKFLCYQENNDSLFAECCWGDTCKNNLAEQRVDFDKYQVFTTGSALHTIISFDDQKIDDANIVEDEFKTYVRTSGSNFDIFPSRNLGWSEFDTLNFDVMYQGNGVPESFSIVNCDFDLNTSTIYDFTELEGAGIIFSASNWYRVSVDYSNCGVSDGVGSLTFNYNLNGGDDALSISFDNFFLSSSNPNLDTRYCSAMAGKWLDGLNPSESFDNIDYSNFSSWGPYSYACDDQLSFGWTARHCCGSKTSKDNYGEYYDDINGGCFGGFPIDNEERVGDALNLPHHDFLNRLLFFDGSFLVCGPDDFFGFDSLKVSYDGIASNIDLINDSERSTLFETKGMWYCDPDGWRKLADANKMRIIAATLKEMADTDYSLHCGELDYVMNLNVSPYYEDDDYSGYVSVSDSCVLKSGSSVIIGTPISSNVIDDFLNNNLKSFHPLRDDESDYSCSEFSHPFDAHHFYQECTTGDWLNASYNEPFGILLFSLKESSSQNGFFGFFVDFWEGIVFFFTSLFDAEQSQDFISIPSTADEAEFKELYINKVGDKKIYGIREKDTIMVNYENFNSNLTFLKDLSELWFDEQEGEFSTTFNIENNNQILGINGTIVDDFNWNYLTSNLKFG
ncbi:hypothetical protein CMO90_02830, partial [Candidatus Woesearchaeota archaeon]|nr:hypothetical protein [Candidatus Woesearchaeota archaeon]